MLGKDLYDQMIIVSIKENGTIISNKAFSMSFMNIFMDYPLGEMQITDTKWKHWIITPLRLWQTQLNLPVFGTLSACGISSKHLNYQKHSMVRLLYQFQAYYQVRRVLKRVQVPLPCESGFTATNNPYSGKGLFMLCEDYGVPHDSMRY